MASPEVGHAVADAGVLDAAGDAGVARAGEGVLDRFQGGAHAHARGQDLTRRGAAALGERVVPAELPAVEAAELAQLVDAAFHGKRRLVGAEAAHRAAGEVVGVDGPRLDVDVRHVVRAGRVAGRALEHLHPDRGVGAGVADDARAHRVQHALRRAADLVLHVERMTLGVDPDRLVAGELDLDGAAERAGHQRGVALHAEVFLASEPAAVGHERDLDLLFFEAEQQRHLTAVLVDALALRPQAHARLRG